MRLKPFLLGVLVFTLLILTGCDVDIDAPQTPTVIASPTFDETAIARLWTKTPALTRTPSPSPTLTATGTATATPTITASPTLTATMTATVTPSQTATLAATITSSPTATRTPTATASPTTAPSRTPTRTAAPTHTATATRTATPTESIQQLEIPSATPRATATFTPFPSITPNLTATRIAENTPYFVPTITPGGIYTLPTVHWTESSTAAPSEGDGTFYDPNAAPASDQDSLPVASIGDTGPGGPVMREQEYIVVSYAGQVVPLLDIPNGIGAGSPMAQGKVFAVSGGGQVAAVGGDHELYVGGQRLGVSPASQFGLHPNLSFGDLVWSPDELRLAMRVDAADPNAFNALDSGIWIYEPGTNRSWQIFRDTYQGQVAQLHEQRRALRVQWSPNGGALVVSVETPLGPANVFMSVWHNANEFINSIPYADATWTTDSAALIVSGVKWGEMTVIGRVALDTNWTYTEYLNQQTTGLVMQAALQLSDGRIAFLGGPTPDSFALYIVQAAPGALPLQISPMITGQIVAAEWKPDRTAVLVTTQTGGAIRLWIVRIDGTAQDATPAAGTPDAAHWR